MAKPIKIIDIIHHKNKCATQIFHVIDRMPSFFYERDSTWLIGEDSGFFNFYYHEQPSGRFKAFAGRGFIIPMKDGSKIEAKGQWWDGVKPDYQELLCRVAVGTPKKLARCNVFSGMLVDPHIIRHVINPSNNYNKYDKRSADFGKHTIKSKWVEIKITAR